MRGGVASATALAAVVYCDEANNGSRGAQLPLKQLPLLLLSCFLFLCFFLRCHGSSPYEWFNNYKCIRQLLLHSQIIVHDAAGDSHFVSKTRLRCLVRQF